MPSAASTCWAETWAAGRGGSTWSNVFYLAFPVTPDPVSRGRSRLTWPFVQLPVVSDDLDDVLGVLYVNDLFRSSTLKRAIGVSLPATDEITRKIRRPLMLPETLDLLEYIQVKGRKEQRTFALVVGRAR